MLCFPQNGVLVRLCEKKTAKIGTFVHVYICVRICTYILMYTSVWLLSLNFKNTDYSTYPIYKGICISE